MTGISTFSAIDLSRLPAPDAIEPLDYETIYGEMLARLRTFIPDFDDSLESDPAVRILQVAAYFRLLDRQRVNDAIRAVMIAYAAGADLDHLAAVFGVARLTVTPADPENNIAAVMESDDDLRRRVILAPEGYSVAGPVGAYIFHALTAHADVLDASATSPEPGQVVVSLLARDGDGTASAALIDAVEAALNAESVRPITDEVIVASAEIVDYEIAAQIWTYPGPDAAIVLAEAESRLAAYRAAQRRIGRDITLSGIYAALHVEGVQRVALPSPAADIPISETQAANCIAATVTHMGTAE